MRLRVLWPVTVAFLACGAISGPFIAGLSDTFSVVGNLLGLRTVLVAIPFSILCPVLCVDWRGERGLGSILAIPLVWLVARLAAVSTFLFFQRLTMIPFGIAGLTGGILLALALGITNRRYLTWKCIGSAGGIGFIAAIPFWDMRWYDTTDGMNLVALSFGFASWQAAVGTYLHLAGLSTARTDASANPSRPGSASATQ